MVFPLIQAAAIMQISAMQGVYSSYSQSQKNSKSDQAYNYEKAYGLGYNTENDRFWADYIRAHKIYKPVKYPYRSGMNYNLSSVYAAEAGLNANKWAQNDAMVNGAFNTGKSGSYVYGFSQK